MRKVCKRTPTQSREVSQVRGDLGGVTCYRILIAFNAKQASMNERIEGTLRIRVPDQSGDMSRAYGITLEYSHDGQRLSLIVGQMSEGLCVDKRCRSARHVLQTRLLQIGCHFKKRPVLSRRRSHETNDPKRVAFDCGIDCPCGSHLGRSQR